MTMNEPHSPDDGTAPRQHALGAADARLVDRLVEAGWEASKVTPSTPEEARALEALVGISELLHRYPAPSPDQSLVDATLLSVERADEERAARFAFTDAPIARTRWRLPDFISVAACLLLLVGVAMPIAARVRETSSQTLCANGLRELGGAVAAYSSDSNGHLPMVAGIGPLLASGSAGDLPASLPRDNARAVAVLAERGYCKPGCLHCAGARQLSFRVPLHPSHFRSTTLVLSPLAADANPLFAPLPASGIAELASASPNHGGAGQNILFSDGSVVWSVHPFVRVGPQQRRDNIWTIPGPKGADRVDLKNVHFDRFEVFLGQ